MRIYVRTLTACKKLAQGRNHESIYSPFRFDLSQDAYATLTVSIRRPYTSTAHSQCFLCFFYFMEYYPTALWLTSEKYRCWVYMEYLRLGAGYNFCAICTLEAGTTDLVSSQCPIRPVGCPFRYVASVSIPAHKTLSQSLRIAFAATAANE